MNEGFEVVCLFGYSPHFAQIASDLDSTNARCFVVFGPRQRHAIEALTLPKSAEKLCIHDLSDSAYQNIEVRRHASLGISIGSPFIFNQKDIDDFHGHLINSHGAPLPEFKGGGGFSWRILQRDKRGVILMHLVTTQIDEGACVFRKDFTFSEEERIPDDLEKRQRIEEAKYLVPWINKIACGKISLTRSPHNCQAESKPGTYFPRLSWEIHGCIDWSLAVRDLENFVHAFSKPYPGAFTFIKSARVHIMDFRIHEECYMHPFTYGLILSTAPDGFLVAGNGGSILIRHDDLRVETSNLHLTSGDRFFTPLDLLQKAMSSRAFYKPDGLVVRNYGSD